MRKTLALAGSILLFTFAALAQSPRTVPCIVDAGTAGADGKHVAEWKPREAIRGVFTIAAGEQVVMPFTMPAEGNCEARFFAFDGRDEMVTEVQDLPLGRTLKKLPAAEAEIIILDQAGIDARNREEKFETRSAPTRGTNGGLGGRLPAGDYFFVISNKDPKKIPIKVFFWLGHADEVDLSEK